MFGGRYPVTSLRRVSPKGPSEPREDFSGCVPKTASQLSPATIDKTANNLPIQLTTYIGRSNDITTGVELLRSHRLITITGPGGSENSALASDSCRGAGRLSERSGFRRPYGCDACTCPLHSTPTIHAVMQLGELEQEVAASIFDSKALLVLDNCEHVIDAAALQVIQLLSRCPT